MLLCRRISIINESQNTGSLFSTDVPKFFLAAPLLEETRVSPACLPGCWMPVSCWWLCWWQPLSHRVHSLLLPFCLLLRWEGREVVIYCHHYSIFSGKAHEIFAHEMSFSSKEGLCVSFKKKKKDRSSSWSSTVTGRADGRWRGRRAAPPPLAPASCFMGLMRPCPSQSRLPGCMSTSSLCQQHQKLPASQTGRAKATWQGSPLTIALFLSQLLKWLRAWDLCRSQSAQKRKNTILHQVVPSGPKTKS